MLEITGPRGEPMATPSICDDKLIVTKITRKQMKKILLICTKEMHFSLNNRIYKQIDGVAMGSPLGPVLANVFMVELEKQVLPLLAGKVSSWERYVDDTFTFVKKGEIDNVINILNGFHEDVQFTHEVEKDGTIAFLDVNVIKKDDGTFTTSVYRKKTDTNLYINWKAFAPKQWKIGTLKGMFRRAFLICSEQEGLDAEISHLKHVFIKINGYPKKVVYETLAQIARWNEERIAAAAAAQLLQGATAEGTTTAEVPEEEIHPYISLPYKGMKGDLLLKQLKQMIKRCLPSNVIPRFTFKGKKLGSFFRVKDKIKLGHQTDLVYSFVDEEVSHEDKPTEYVGMTNVRFETRTYQHRCTDKASAVYKHLQTHNKQGSDLDFSVLESGYNKGLDRRIAEAIFTKERKPFLNLQKNTYKLELFN